jgi:hypothetical protein
VRCPRCAAFNPEGADWCGQCLVPIGRDADPGASTPSDADPPPSAGGPRPAGVPSDAPVTGDLGPAAVDARAGDVRSVDGEVEWRCTVCAGWNALLDPACATCGAARHGFGSAGGVRTGRPSVGGTAAVVLTAFWPGAGHAAVGRVGSGAARALLWLLWAGGALWLSSGAQLTPAARVAALVTAMGALVLWVATLIDVRRVVSGGAGGGRPVAQILDPRRLAALVGVVTVGLLVAPLVVGGR